MVAAASVFAASPATGKMNQAKHKPARLVTRAAAPRLDARLDARAVAAILTCA
jgi:hypothetical protein